MSQLIIATAIDLDSESAEPISLPEGARHLGHTPAGEWFAIPDSSAIPEGARLASDGEVRQALLSLPGITSLKASVRRKIESEVGDLHDLVADQAKQIEALTALTCRIATEYLGGAEIAPEHRATYLARVESVVSALDSGSVSMRGDTEGADNMLERLLSRADKVNRIVEKHYLARRDSALSVSA